jgi:putative membrane protein
VADFGALTPVAVLAALYAVALTRPSAGTDPGRARIITGAAGVVALAAAFGPPLDGAAAHSLTAHMLQHVLLLAIAPPLLVLGLVPSTVGDALPAEVRSRLRRVSVPLRGAIERIPVFVLTAVAVALQTAALAVWHVPAIYDAAVAHLALHALEHLTFLVTGIAFWWIVAGAGRRAGTAAAVITIFVASLPGTLLGALMTLSTAPWYPQYARGTLTAALQDQQLAGVVMWAVGGMAYVVAGAALFVAWLRDLERASPSRTPARHLEALS